jgi:hypothetical protein
MIFWHPWNPLGVSMIEWTVFQSIRPLWVWVQLDGKFPSREILVGCSKCQLLTYWSIHGVHGHSFHCKMKIYENKRYISLKNKHYQTEECYFRKYCTLLCKSYSTAKLLQLKVATNAWKKTYWDPIFGRLHFFLASFDCYQFFFLLLLSPSSSAVYFFCWLMVK